MMSDYRITETGNISNGVATLEAPAPDRVVELTAQVEKFSTEVSVLQGRISNLDARIEYLTRDLQTARQRHIADIATIGEALTAEAQNRSWCEEYQKFIEGVNSKLNVELPQLEQEFEVEVTETISVTLRKTITVNATDSDSAEEAAQESFESDWSEYDFRDAYRNGDYEVTDTEYEVQ